ncbi:radical SAM protein [Streptosporangium sp. NPDC000396]|uniref:radical SAM protein n=1 Tax=Streptosporangium sp. NPDC000396 TaxID=3366185 RepID=UPI0036AAA150
MYTVVVEGGDGDYLVYNTLSGAFLKTPGNVIRFLVDDPVWRSAVCDLSPFQRYLHDVGILVDVELDEFEISRRLLEESHAREDRLELFLLPHENCNFRCTYCYESFARNKMEPWVVEATKRLVLTRSGALRSLSTSWFGGEPLLGYDVICELSAFFVELCRQADVNYQSGITTNGYLLDAEKARHLIHDCQVRQFQITLDGPCEQHDRRRHLMGGGGTYERIYQNLKDLKEIPESFNAMIRVNFDHEVGAAMDDFLRGLRDDFAGDPRFLIHFFPIVNLGGATRSEIDELPLCDVNATRVLEYQLLERAVDYGFRTMTRDQIQPLGSTCYAADPRNFIIGADGTIYKCTVAFDDPRNHVGVIQPDGSLQIDAAKLGLWTEHAGASDPHCQSCTLNPSCQGMACPLYRMNTASRACVPMKSDLPRTIRFLAREMVAQEARQCQSR